MTFNELIARVHEQGPEEYTEEDFGEVLPGANPTVIFAIAFGIGLWKAVSGIDDHFTSWSLSSVDIDDTAPSEVPAAMTNAVIEFHGPSEQQLMICCEEGGHEGRIILNGEILTQW